MKSSFLVWDWADIEGACFLQPVAGVEKAYQLREGAPLLADFPPEAMFSMDPDLPDDTILTDNLMNVSRLVVVSVRLKEFLEARDIPKLEYLPVRILNHNRKPVGTDYFIIHPLDPVDCLDTKASGATWSSIDPESIRRVQRLVINETQIDARRRLFRPKCLADVTLIGRDLAHEVDTGTFTGTRWRELEDYPRPPSG